METTMMTKQLLCRPGYDGVRCFSDIGLKMMRIAADFDDMLGAGVHID